MMMSVLRRPSPSGISSNSLLVAEADGQHVFHVMRFESEQEAERVARDIKALIKSDLGVSYTRPAMRAQILRPLTGDRRRLFFTNGALAAARQSGIRLPIADGFATEAEIASAHLMAGTPT